MEARSKTIEAWFSMIEQGQVKLPRFQRHEAWRPAQIAGLFENILRSPSLPLGVLLVLEVGDKELFHSRPIVGAPASEARPIMHVLDGQQRMTALWRSLTDNYEDLKVFVRLRPANEEADGEVASINEDAAKSWVETEKRWERNGVRQPVWADDNVACIQRGLAPLSIFRPGSVGEASFKAWREQLRSGGVYTDEIGLDQILLYLLPVNNSEECDRRIRAYLQARLRVSPLIKYINAEEIQKKQFQDTNRKTVKFIDLRL